MNALKERVRIDDWNVMPRGSVAVGTPEERIRYILTGYVTDHPRLGTPLERVYTTTIQTWTRDEGEILVETRNTTYLLGTPADEQPFPLPAHLES